MSDNNELILREEMTNRATHAGDCRACHHLVDGEDGEVGNVGKQVEEHAERNCNPNSPWHIPVTTKPNMKSR